VSPRSRLTLVAAAAAVLIGGFLIANNSGDDGNDKPATTATTPNEFPPPPTVPTIRVVNAKPVGGITKLKFKKGDQIRFRVVSDTADEIHVHGYDLMKDVDAGGSISYAFKATIEGKFEIELEGHKQQIAELTVEP
jgi:hypothetical protein